MKVIISNNSKIGVGKIVVDNKNKISKVNFSRVNHNQPFSTKSTVGVVGKVLVDNRSKVSKVNVVRGVYSTPDTASIFVSDSPPLSPKPNNLWWQSNTGSLKVYYSDINSSQWVDIVASGRNEVFVGGYIDGGSPFGNSIDSGFPSSVFSASFDGGTSITDFTNGPVLDLGGVA